jgi:hypothetical protein
VYTVLDTVANALIVYEFKGDDMPEKSIEKLIEENHKDLKTKYNVLVKRTNSIISSLTKIDAKMDFLVEKMAMFELMEDEDEDEEEEYESYDEDENEEDEY